METITFNPLPLCGRYLRAYCIRCHSWHLNPLPLRGRYHYKRIEIQQDKHPLIHSLCAGDIFVYSDFTPKQLSFNPLPVCGRYPRASRPPPCGSFFNPLPLRGRYRCRFHHRLCARFFNPLPLHGRCRATMESRRQIWRL